MVSRAARLLALIVTLTPSIAPAQGTAPAASSTGVVILRGRVMESEPPVPVSRARVTVTSNGTSDPVFADEEGRFEVRVPESGAYTVAVVKAGFVPSVLERPAERRAQPIEVGLMRGAVVTGRVMDSTGRPVVNIPVRARRIDGPAAERTRERWAETNDLGEYRIWNLEPGRYAIVTNGSPGNPGHLPSTAEPSQNVQARIRSAATPDDPTSNAVVVQARAGVENDVTLAYRTQEAIMPDAEIGGAVTGIVVDEWGDPAGGLDVRLWQVRVEDGQRSLQPFGEPRGTDDGGRFRLFHVPAGTYVVVLTDESWRTDGTSSSGWLPVYYPGRTSRTEALPLLVGPGDEIAGIDLVFRWTRGSRVF
jgi:hypothetical protein